MITDPALSGAGLGDVQCGDGNGRERQYQTEQKEVCQQNRPGHCFSDELRDMAD